MAKPMPLLNYTTGVEVEKTVAELTRILVRHGATGILTEYQSGSPSSLCFVIASPRGVDTYRLPARVDRVHEVLIKQNKAGLIARRFATRDQAERVGWRIVKDWTEAQLAIVAAGMVDLDEILLPYLLNGKTTFYEWFVENRRALPAP